MELKEEQMNEEFTKYHLLGFPFDAVLHKFTPLDLTPQIHDHPFGFNSFIVKGSYVERRYFKDLGGSFIDITHKQGESFFVPATAIHAIIAYPEGECWTLILPEPWERESLEWKFEEGNAYYKSWKPGSEWKLHKAG